MSDAATLKLVILWEDELRLAAKLLREMRDVPDDQKAEAYVAALRACAVALHGIDDDAVVVMVGNAEIRARAKAGDV